MRHDSRLPIALRKRDGEIDDLPPRGPLFSYVAAFTLFLSLFHTSPYTHTNTFPLSLFRSSLLPYSLAHSYRSSRFHAKSRPPLIQRRPTGHSSRTAHYRYYKLGISSFPPSPPFSFSLSSVDSYQIIIIVVCFAARPLPYSPGNASIPSSPDPSRLFAMGRRGDRQFVSKFITDD